MSEITYAGYIRVPELLSLQQPRSRNRQPLTYVCEHLFIVTHQTSELWLAQVLLDLDAARLALTDARYVDAAECLQRAAAVLDVMAANLEVLAAMPPGRFACFRGELGRASGAQSTQFAGLDRRLGLRGKGDAPLLEALTTACERDDVTLEGLLRLGTPTQPELARVALSMLDVSRKTWKWKVVHLELTAKMLGHQQSGTGGTPGTSYLAGRLAMPFRRLWDAVSVMQQDAGATTQHEPASAGRLLAS